MTCAAPAAAHAATIPSPAKLTLELIRHAQRAAAAPLSGGVSIPMPAGAPRARATGLVSGGASIAPRPLAHRGASLGSTPINPHHARPGTSQESPSVQPIPGPIQLPIPVVRLPRGQVNVVVIIRINSPGNDGPITQVNETSVTVASQATLLRRSCGAPRLASSADPASAAVSWATRCAAAIRAADPRVSVRVTRTARPRPDRPAAIWRPVPAAHPPPVFEPVRLVVGPAPSVRRVTGPAHPHHEPAPALSQSAPPDPPSGWIPSGWIPSAPGPAASFAPAGGQGGAVLGLLAIICLTALPAVLGGYASPRSVMREMLRTSRLERPG